MVNRRAFVASLFAPLLLRLLPKPAEPTVITLVCPLIAAEDMIVILSGDLRGKSFRVVHTTSTTITVRPCF